MTDRRSLSEIRATCTKAARGAGCPWGMAEEAGMAAKTLSAFGLPGAEAVAGLLETPRACRCDGRSGALCGLQVMTGLSDAPPEAEVQLEDVIVAPVLILSGLHRAATDTRSWQVEWQGGSALCSRAMISVVGDPPPPIADGLRILPVADQGAAGTPNWTSRPVAAGAWDALLALCQKTYVPESDLSRQAGAGPGGSETD